eukprot:scaffold100385_cov21-Tisochrysis_lutea.AAC.1
MRGVRSWIIQGGVGPHNTALGKLGMVGTCMPAMDGPFALGLNMRDVGFICALEFARRCLYGSRATNKLKYRYGALPDTYASNRRSGSSDSNK